MHLVYKYYSASRELKVFNDLKIEIQVRSKLQHAWATAVEAVDFFTNQALKSSLGELSWLRFFALVGSEFARIEKRTLVPGTPLDPKEAKAELLSHKSHITSLIGFNTATKVIDSNSTGIKGHMFLLELDTEKRTLRTNTFTQEQLPLAQEKYLEAEKSNKGRPEMQTVLVSVDSIVSLRKAYPSYYLDIGEFIKVLNKIISE